MHVGDVAAGEEGQKAGPESPEAVEQSAPAPETQGRSGTATFATMCAGQIVSLFGSRLTSFVLGVWVFQTTGSATKFSLFAFFAIVPQLALSPISGALVDRWDRRWVMIISDTGAALGTLAIIGLLRSDNLEIWHLYAVTAFSACFGAFQGPAFLASVPLLVRKSQLVRANGMASLGASGSLIVAPLVAPFFLSTVGMSGVIAIDLLTFLISAVVLLMIRIPRPKKVSVLEGGDKSLFREALMGWTFVRERKGFVALLLLFSFTNFNMGLIHVLTTPMVLSFATEIELGRVLSLAAIGMLLGSLAISIWGGGRRNRVTLILIFFGIQGLVLTLGGVKPSIPLISAAVVVFTFCTPFISANVQATWQAKVPLDLQGRVLAVRRLIAMGSLPLAYLLAGPLVDLVFEPLLAPGGLLVDSVGQYIGVGRGRGIGLLFMVIGFSVLTMLVLVSRYQPLRRIETDLPDMVGDEAITT
ncbi:MAG: MFS transporter [Deltaproteobacteria bacterium]|nr:MFS transporter [Deltaproteobacteria bacterium]